MSGNDLMAALEQFDISESNLAKIETLWAEMEALLPKGLSRDDNPEYDERRRAYDLLLNELPAVGGFRPEREPPTPDQVGQMRIEYLELGEPGAEFAVDQWIAETGRSIQDYRFKFQAMRRTLVRKEMLDLIAKVDGELVTARTAMGEGPTHDDVGDALVALKALVGKIAVLIGSGSRPPRWTDLQRHLSFALRADFNDIVAHDWPAVRAGLQADLYQGNEAKPVAVKDLADLVAAKPHGSVTTALSWGKLDDDGFERVIFDLISRTEGYENPEWLMSTRAADRGRDLSVFRVIVDPLSGTTRQRVIIQCKHWLTKSIRIPDISATLMQMDLWGDPRVDVLVFATSGRFTGDAVTWIEKHNGSGKNPKIEKWPESHLELLLSSRPAIVGAYGLREV
jgi:hypothetical protein